MASGDHKEGCAGHPYIEDLIRSTTTLVHETSKQVSALAIASAKEGERVAKLEKSDAMQWKRLDTITKAQYLIVGGIMVLNVVLVLMMPLIVKFVEAKVVR